MASVRLESWPLACRLRIGCHFGCFSRTRHWPGRLRAWPGRLKRARGLGIFFSDELEKTRRPGGGDSAKGTLSSFRVIVSTSKQIEVGSALGSLYITGGSRRKCRRLRQLLARCGSVARLTVRKLRFKLWPICGHHYFDSTV